MSHEITAACKVSQVDTLEGDIQTHLLKGRAHNYCNGVFFVCFFFNEAVLLRQILFGNQGVTALGRGRSSVICNSIHHTATSKIDLCNQLESQWNERSSGKSNWGPRFAQKLDSPPPGRAANIQLHCLKLTNHKVVFGGGFFCISNPSGCNLNECSPGDKVQRATCVFSVFRTTRKGKGDVAFSQTAFLVLLHVSWPLNKMQPQISAQSKKCNWACRALDRSGALFWCGRRLVSFSTRTFFYLHYMQCCCRTPLAESHLSIQDKPCNIFSFVRLHFI